MQNVPWNQGPSDGLKPKELFGRIRVRSAGARASDLALFNLRGCDLVWTSATCASAAVAGIFDVNAG